MVDLFPLHCSRGFLFHNLRLEVDGAMQPNLQITNNNTIIQEKKC